MARILRSSFRSLIRSPLRTILMVLILTVSIGLSLVMLTVSGAYQNELNTISTQIGTDVEVRPAGFFGNVGGGVGGGEPLDETKVDEIAKLTHVVSISKTVQARYTGNSLVSAIQPGTLGNQQSQPSGNNSTNGNSSANRQFRMAIQVNGFDVNNKNPSLTGGGSLKIAEGRYFNPGEDDAKVSVIGKDLATANNLSLNSKIDLNGTDVQIVGIFDSGQLFGNNMIILPVKTAETIFNIKGVTNITVTVDDANNEDAVVTEIRTIFDEKTADVTTSSSAYQRISTPINNAINTSRLAMIISFIAAGIIIILSVILIIRQRIKEVGILKAIGASNLRIGLQFIFETFFISVLSAMLGALITFPLAQKIGTLLVSTGNSFGNSRDALFAGGAVTRIGGVNIAVNPNIFLYALLIAVALAVVSSTIPMLYISQVKPAEVLRYE